MAPSRVDVRLSGKIRPSAKVIVVRSAACRHVTATAQQSESVSRCLRIGRLYPRSRAMQATTRDRQMRRYGRASGLPVSIRLTHTVLSRASCHVEAPPGASAEEAVMAQSSLLIQGIQVTQAIQY